MTFEKTESVMRAAPFLIKRLLDFPDLCLEVVAGQEGLDRIILLPEVNRPALELSGFFDKWQPDRVQILGTGEIAYLQTHKDNADVLENVRQIFASGPPCVVVTRGLPILDEMKEMADQHKISILRSSLHTTQFTKRLWDHLEYDLSPYVVKRGVMMDIFNVGVLISGPSSVGKSECALELMHKGHTFVADDLITIRGSQFFKLIASGHSLIPYHMEVRGIGIIDISRMYGPRNIRESKQLDMVVQLEEWDAHKEYERLGIETNTTNILGVNVPCYSIPVKPGRNIASIVEVAILDYKLKDGGVHMAREFDEKLIQIMKKREGR
jgi:HPr kinase/phosphorylase